MKLVWVLVISLFLATRLFNLGLIPIFNDEANYIFWAKNIATTGQGWFISLTNGKPPIFIWEIVLFLRLLPENQYLVAGRLPSVLAGLFTLLGLFELTRLLFKTQRTAFLATIIYIFSPFTLFYDRLALFDSLLQAASIWSVYFSLKAAMTGKLPDGVKWGIALGLALLSKTPGAIFLLLTPICYLVFARKKRLDFIVFAILIAQMIHLPLFLSRGASDYIKLATGYTAVGSGHPASFSLDWLPWSISFLTAPIFLLGLVGLTFLIRQQPKVGLILVNFWLVPILIFSYIVNPFFPRYFLFAVPYFLIAVAYILNRLPILTMLLVFPIWFSLLLLTRPEQAPLPDIEEWQYISGYPSSAGFKPIYQYIDRTLENRPVTLFVQGSFSHFPHAFDLYYWGNPKIKIYERWPLTQIDDQMRQAKKTSQVFVVVRKNLRATENDPMEELPLRVLVEGKKSRGPDSVYLTTFD